VAVGLLPALWLSEKVAGLDPAVEGDVRALLRMHELPTGFTGVDAASVREALRRDKKSVEGRVRFVLLERVGKPVWGVDVDDELIDLAIGRALAG
jgi:3-dehydroquinate synthase